MPGDDSVALWGRQYDKARTHLMALGVAGVEEAAGALEEAGVAVHRRDAGILVLDPAATGDVQVAIVDTLLPGDPRAAA
jgi:hypothetical protein